jgi:hypothetical protein
MRSSRPDPAAGEVHTPFYCLHPFFGYVCRPNAILDFSDTVPESFGHRAIAEIGPDGFRNLQRLEHKPPHEVWIGLFGGSVAFAPASTTNATTISAYLERELNAQSGRQRTVRVWNLALPAGQQPQQAIILLTHAADLDGVITFDGVNEAVIGAYFNKQQIPDHFPFRPIYEPLYGGTITAQQAAWSLAIEDAETWVASTSRIGRFWVERIARQRIAEWRSHLRATGEPQQPFTSLFPRAECPNVDESIGAGVERWREMILTMHAIAQARNIDSSFVLQPVPEREKALTAVEHRGVDAFPDLVALRQRAYPRLQEIVAELTPRGIDCVEFGSVFAGTAEAIYTDHIHFEDRGCEIVARQLARHVVANWRCLS